MKNKIWHMHTGSAPECQDTPSVKFKGKKYILSQDAYITGTHDNPYYEAYAYGMDYKTYLVKWAITADINSTDYDVDNSNNACDWDNPISVTRC